MRLLPVLGIGIVGVAAIAAGVFLRPHGGGRAFEVAPLSAPAGVTFQTAKTGGTVLLAMAGISIPATGTVYAYTKGMTLYSYDKDLADGKSAFTGDCAWQPSAERASARKTERSGVEPIDTIA